MAENKKMPINKNELVGQSAAMRDVRRLIEIAAPKKTTVLIQGATGTGKELVAQSIHLQSKRKGDFVSINCSAIPAELLESELFGYEKGAFTGAEKMRAGRFEMSSGGTLFLDEIGDMPLPLQAKLLRAIETKHIQRVGGGKDVPIDLRLVCATHQNIEADIESGKFRADLFYRINVFPLKLPTLAERSVDIPQIIAALCTAIQNSDSIENVPVFDDTAVKEFARYPWPGNVRELENLVLRLLVLVDDVVIRPSDITAVMVHPRTKEEAVTEGLSPSDPVMLSLAGAAQFHIDRYFRAHDDDLPPAGLYTRVMAEVEKPLIEETLRSTAGNQLKAADVLGLNRNTLRKKIRELGITLTGHRRSGRGGR